MICRTLRNLLSALALAALGANAVAHGIHLPPTKSKPAAPRYYTLLDHGDVEGVGYSLLPNGKWDLYIHDLLHGVEYAPDAAIVRVLDTARTQVPANSNYSFLGAPGAPVWLLPQSQDEALALGVVSLGHTAQTIAPGTFTGDITLRLTALTFTPEPGVSAAGHFALFTNDALGVPTVLFDSRDGFSAGDATAIAAGEHRHFNWAFSQPGLYKLTYQASATRAGSATPATDTKTFLYRVRSADAPLTLWSVGETLVVNGAAARVTVLGLPAVSSAARAAVRATLAGTGINGTNNSAILLRADGETTVFARTGSEAPPLPGSKFKKLGDPAFSGAGFLHFTAMLVVNAGGVTSASDDALFSQYDAGGGATALGVVWREGMDAPGSAGARFTALHWYFPSGDGFIFGARTTAGSGVWRASFAGGVPVFTLLIMEKQPFLTDQALKIPRTIALPTTIPKSGGTSRAIAADGTVTLYVRFTDGTSELLQFAPPAP